METASNTKEFISKYGIKMTFSKELTEKAIKVKAALTNDPKIKEYRKVSKIINKK